MILRALQYYFSQRKQPLPRETSPDTTPAAGVDWHRYMGRWFELARFETPFEFGLDDVWTEYAMRPNGQVSITNYGSDAAGRVHQARGLAWPVADGALQVSFVPLLRFISSPYHVLRVDEDYQHALVSNASGSCLWVLSRHAHVPGPLLLPLLQDAAHRGFDVARLLPTRQSANEC